MPKPTRPVTLRDVAIEAGVSVNAASRALREMPDIGAETKDKIREAAARLGYRKNQAAVRLKTNRSQQIGLIVGDVLNPFVGCLLRGVERVCLRSGFSVMLSNTNCDPSEEEARVRSFIDLGVDGILILPCDRSPKSCQRIVQMLDDEKFPYLLTSARYPGVETSFVMSDDVKGGYLAAEHLYGLGHRRFALLFQNTKTSPVRGRIEGFEQYLREQGLEPAQCIRYPQWPNNALEPSAAIGELLMGARDYTAIFCYCDYFAADVYPALYAAGLRIPEDISVMGYDNVHMSSCLWPQLSTINIDGEVLGEVSARELMQIIESPYEGIQMRRQIVFQPSLVVRGSTAPPRVR